MRRDFVTKDKCLVGNFSTVHSLPSSTALIKLPTLDNDDALKTTAVISDMTRHLENPTGCDTYSFSKKDEGDELL